MLYVNPVNLAPKTVTLGSTGKIVNFFWIRKIQEVKLLQSPYVDNCLNNRAATIYFCLHLGWWIIALLPLSFGLNFWMGSKFWINISLGGYQSRTLVDPACYKSSCDHRPCLKPTWPWRDANRRVTEPESEDTK